MKKYFTFAAVFFLFLAVKAQTPEEINEAYMASSNGKWVEAADAFGKLVEKNPTNHEFWVRLAQAHSRNAAYTRSNFAYKKAIETGPWPDIYWYLIALNHAKQKDTVNTLMAIQNSIRSGWPKYDQLENEKDFAFLKFTVGFRKLLGQTLKENPGRVDKWKADFLFMKERLRHIHYNLYNTFAIAEWTKIEKEILSNIHKWDDGIIMAAFMRYAALAGEGHTKIVPPKEGANAFYTIPVTLYCFKDGIHITETIKDDAAILGKKLIAIDGVPAEELYQKAYSFWGHDNEYHHKKITPRVMLMQPVLQSLGVNGGKTSSLLKIAGDNGVAVEYVINLKTLKEFESSAKLNAVSHTREIPLYMLNPAADYWFKYDESRECMYVKLKYILNDGKQTFQSFVDSVFSEIEKRNAKFLVLDLRDCGGGNAALNRFLINKIIVHPGLNKKENFYTIIGRNTYSAAINLAGDLEFRTNTTFIGEPTGSGPNYIGESNSFKLPYSGLILVISNRYHQTGSNNSLDKRKWLAPAILVETNSLQYKNGIDPIMHWIENAISAKQQK